MLRDSSTNNNTIDRPHLTDREMDVLECIKRGMSNRETAKELKIGLKTVENHIRFIFKALQASNRTDAIVKSLKHGILEL